MLVDYISVPAVTLKTQNRFTMFIHGKLSLDCVSLSPHSLKMKHHNHFAKQVHCVKIFYQPFLPNDFRNAHICQLFHAMW